MSLLSINLWLTYGPSASGKSTWAREVAADSNGRIVRLSMDDVRAILGKPSGDPTWSKEFEGVAFKAMLQVARSLVEDGKSLIFDNTHLSPSMPTQIAKAFRHQDVTFHVRDFTDVAREECVRRDRGRTGSAHVGEEVINRQFKIMRTAKSGGLPFRLTSEWLNGFNVLRQVEPVITRAGLPEAVIFDVDGTLTLGPHNRSPYDWHRVLNDKPRPFLVWLAKELKKSGHQVLALSGRSDTCRRDTLAQFDMFGVKVDRLLMRKAGDNRSDDLVKLELFNEHVRDHYRVRAVFDDRAQVVRLWRLLGLQTLQVADGEF